MKHQWISDENLWVLGVATRPWVLPI